MAVKQGCSSRMTGSLTTGNQGPHWCISLLGFSILAAMLCPLAHAGLHSGMQYNSLTTLYTSTNGASWTNKSGWGTGDACGWYGIVCDQDTTPSDNTSNVVGINLYVNNLTGTLPSLAGVPGLQSFIVLSSHQLTGSIQSLAGLSSLKIVELADDQLSGTIPSLTGWNNLQIFYVPFNQLDGSIPSLAGLTNLQQFTVDANKLTGSLPALAGLTSLLAFSASRNQLTGSIPELTGLTSLGDYEVQNNQLTGSLPGLTELTSLSAFKASGNQLTGSIPVVAGLSKLQLFDVGNNLLTGTVPTAPASLTNATLCPNPLDTTPQPSIDPAWDTATGFTPWWANPYPSNNCDDVFTAGFGG